MWRRSPRVFDLVAKRTSARGPDLLVNPTRPPAANLAVIRERAFPKRCGRVRSSNRGEDMRRSGFFIALLSGVSGATACPLAAGRPPPGGGRAAAGGLRTAATGVAPLPEDNRPHRRRKGARGVSDFVRLLARERRHVDVGGRGERAGGDRCRDQDRPDHALYRSGRLVLVA